MRNEIYQLSYYSGEINQIVQVNKSLEDIIRNPNGHSMIEIGLILLNHKRAELGLDPIPTNLIAGNDS